MATCPKCGSKGRKRRAGVYACPRHGILPGLMNLDTLGNPPPNQWQGPPQRSDHEIGEVWQPKLRGVPQGTNNP